MPPRIWPLINDTAAQLERLREELYHARSVIVDLMPEELQRILTSYYHCDSIEGRDRWRHETIEQLIGTVEAPPQPDNGYLIGPRAVCPLCEASSSSPYAEGFTLPEGLRRHLTGWGSTTQCDVVQAAFALARDYFHRKFSAEEEALRVEALAQKARREKTEMLFRTGPHCTGKLRDDFYFSGEPRTDQELENAEARLSMLGFECRVESDRIRSYVKSGPDYIVYADPRSSGAIEFLVYKQSRRSGRNGKVAWEKAYTSFSIPDRWKHQLRNKFASLLKEKAQVRTSRTR